jgi:hypothetical protein
MLLQDRLTLVNEEGDDNENNAQVEVDHVYRLIVIKPVCTKVTH